MDRTILGTTLVSLVASLYLLVFWTRTQGAGDTPLIGKIEPSGTLRRRYARSLQWDDVSAEAPVYLKDYVYTPADVRATVTLLNNKKVELDPETLVQFDDILGDDLLIRLFEGNVRGGIIIRDSEFRLLPFPQISMDDLTDPRVIEARFADMNRRLQDLLRRPYPPRNFAEIAVPGLILDRLSDYEPVPVHPLGKIYNTKLNRWVQFMWAPVPLEGVSYRLQLAKTQKFDPTMDHNEKEFFVSFQFEQEAVYYWRVRAMRKDEVVISRSAMIELSIKKGEKSPTRLRLPQRTSGYTVDIARDMTFRNILRIVKTNDPVCPTANLNVGAYYCRVRAAIGGRLLKIYPMSVK